MKKNCARCSIEFEFGNNNSCFCPILCKWLCKQCKEDFDYQIEAVKINFVKSKSTAIGEDYFPPPWDFVEFPEKTQGWIEFQKEFIKHPEYYLTLIGK